MAGAPSDGDGRRNLPRSYEGMLKFCLENTSEDAGSQAKPMDEEDRKWLREVFASQSENSPVKRLAGNMQVLHEPCDSEEDVQRHTDLLDETLSLCEDIDLAMDFHKIGGYRVLDGLLRSNYGVIRWRAAELIAALVQNNPYCQEKALEVNVLPLLVEMVDSDGDMLVRVKALYAISCLVRQFPEGEEGFLSLDGFSVLMRAMQSDEEKLQVKAAFLLANIVLSDQKHKDTLCKMGMVEQLMSLLRCEHAPYHEHVMRVLVNLAREHAPSLAECRRPELSFNEFLLQHVIDLRDKPEFQEEMVHCQELQKLCFATPTAAPLDR